MSNTGDGRSESSRHQKQPKPPARDIAQEALRRSERLARSRLREIETIYNSVHVGLCVFDRKLRYIRINERLAEINGIPAARHIGRTVREVVPDLADMAEELADRIFRTGEPVLDIELSGVTAARPGVRRHWVQHWLPLKNDSGKVTGINVVVHEVTGQKQTEDRLAYLASFPQRNPNPILEADLDGHIRFMNPAATRLFPDLAERGASHPWLANWSAVTAPFRKGRTETSIRDVSVGERTYQQAFYYSFQEGFVRVYGFDITDRKKAEVASQEAHEQLQAQAEELRAQTEELRRQTEELATANEELQAQREELQAQAEELRQTERALLRMNEELEQRIAERTAALSRANEALGRERHRLNDVLETLPAMICLLRPDYHVAFANRSSREKFGEPAGRRCYEYRFGRTEPCEFCETYTVLETGKPHHWEISSPQGSVIDAYDFPFTDVDGSPMILEMDIDITKRKHVEAELARHRDHLEELVHRRTSQLQEAEQRLARENREIALANRVLRVFVEETGDDLFDKALRIMLEAMESRHGIFGYVDESGDLVCPSMSKLLDECEVANKCIRYPREQWKGLWGRALQKGKTLYTNDPSVVPEGHVPVRNNLVAPILFHGRAIGLLNLANKQTEYTEADRERIESIADRIAPVLYAWIQRELRENERKQMEARLRRLNEQLEERVAERTEQLTRSIDRLQDEMTRRVLAEGKLRKHSKMLEGFFQHTITPLAFLDRQFNFVRVNEAYARADGKTPEYFVGKNHFELYSHEENRAIFEQVVRTRQPYRAYARPFTYPDTPERVTYWDWQLTPLMSEFGEVQFLVLNLADVTEQQKAFEELERRATQLQQLTLELSRAEDRERRRLAEILHDDLQQLLAAAKFHLGLLASRVKDNEPAREIAGQINQMLREAIDRSRSLSHELSPAVLYEGDLGETFEWLAQQVQSKHGLLVHVEALGRIESRSDALRAFLFRTAQEILFNVVKHARAREARLRLRHVRGRIWMTISDRGRGFDPKALSRSAGFGLLSIRERVELLGGRMKIRSATGRGSTFLIAVPDHHPARGTERKTVGALPRGRPMSGGHEGPPLRVLLVDDHEVMREGLAILLGEQEDMKVIGQAGNGREAVELAGKLAPDVVIMDASMPIMAGEEATRQIKRLLPATRIIGLSMSEESRIIRKMRRAGAETYLLKTAPSEELLAAIRKLKA